MLIFGLNVHSQIYFPDANLKQALLNNGVDKNFNNEIEMNEALNAYLLDLSNRNIQDLTGLENFFNVNHLDISNNPNLPGINLANYPNLGDFLCNNCNFSTLDITPLTSVNWVECSGNKLVSLDVSSNSLLNNLDCSNNLLTSLDISSLNDQYLTLVCTGNTNLITVCVSDVSKAVSNENNSAYKKDNTTQWSTCTTSAQNIQNSSVVLYPNPAKDFVVFAGSYLNIEVFNFLGEKVLQTDQNKIDVKNLSEGMYFIKVITNNGQLFTTSFVKE